MRESPAAPWRAATRSSGWPTTRRSTMLLARSKQRRRQRHELRARAVAGHRLDHAAADEDQGAVEVDLDVAARPLDVEREQVLGPAALVEAKARAVPDAARRSPDGTRAQSSGSVTRAAASPAGKRRSALTTDIASSMTRVPVSSANAGVAAAASSATSRHASHARRNRTRERGRGLPSIGADCAGRHRCGRPEKAGASPLLAGCVPADDPRDGTQACLRFRREISTVASSPASISM